MWCICCLCVYATVCVKHCDIVWLFVTKCICVCRDTFVNEWGRYWEWERKSFCFSYLSAALVFHLAEVTSQEGPEYLLSDDTHAHCTLTDLTPFTHTHIQTDVHRKAHTHTHTLRCTNKVYGHTYSNAGYITQGYPYLNTCKNTLHVWTQVCTWTHTRTCTRIQNTHKHIFVSVVACDVRKDTISKELK